MSMSSPTNTFQISTESVSPSHQVHTGSEIVINNAEEQVRIDNAINLQRSPHFRAKQFQEFTNWLSQSNVTSKQQTTSKEASKPMKSLMSKPAGKPKKIYRVDAPKAHESKISRPNFDTKNYVADPSDLARTIAELKSDGRVIGDSQQSQHASAANPPIQKFQWPSVTEVLMESPGLQNLELNIQKFLNRNCKRVVVCADQQGSGATTIATSLARQLSARNKKVLLVDANISNAVIANRLSVQFQSSWLQAISQRSTLPEVIVADRNSNVSLFPLRNLNQVNWPRRILDQLGATLHELNQYDVIICDAGSSTQLLEETSTPKALGDLTLLVTNATSESNYDLQKQKSLLLSSNPGSVIIVENFSASDTSSRSLVG